MYRTIKVDIKRIAILGSGNIGCDLLVKCQEVEGIKVVSFAGRHANSKGLEFATRRGVPTTDRSIEGVLEDAEKPDILIDCTSAAHHPHNYDLCRQHGIRVIDMTPAKLGVACCPVVNLEHCLEANNINMISCGGQASIPICFAIKQANPHIQYIEVVSTISSASAGPGTRRNISEYITATQKAISNMLDIHEVKVIINITPAIPPIHMRTSILVNSEDVESEVDARARIEAIAATTRGYVPGYHISVELQRLAGKMMCQLQVTGSGHYLPAYAGNLDIINCAALEVIQRL
jgi:acetaldehyde dehydrogenase (acetylating)